MIWTLQGIYVFVVAAMYHIKSEADNIVHVGCMCCTCEWKRAVMSRIVHQGGKREGSAGGRGYGFYSSINCVVCAAARTVSWKRSADAMTLELVDLRPATACVSAPSFSHCVSATRSREKPGTSIACTQLVATARRGQPRAFHVAIASKPILITAFSKKEKEKAVYKSHRSIIRTNIYLRKETRVIHRKIRYMCSILREGIETEQCFFLKNFFIWASMSLFVINRLFPVTAVVF